MMLITYLILCMCVCVRVCVCKNKLQPRRMMIYQMKRRVYEVTGGLVGWVVWRRLDLGLGGI